MADGSDYEVFEAGDVTLQSGIVFPSLRLAYKTYGTLAPAKDNIIPILFGNGLSSSPSYSPLFQAEEAFPAITYHDAVAVQRRLLVEQFGSERIALVYGWSMGGMQAYHWAACHPDMVERAAVVCGSARCSPYNQVFLESVLVVLF